MANTNEEEQIRHLRVSLMDCNVEGRQRKFFTFSVPALGRGVDLVSFSSVYLSASFAVLLFVHPQSKLSNLIFSDSKSHLM